MPKYHGFQECIECRYLEGAICLWWRRWVQRYQEFRRFLPALEMIRCQWCLEFSLWQDARDALDSWSSADARMPGMLRMPLMAGVQLMPGCQGCQWCLEFSVCQFARDGPVMPGVQHMPGFQGCQWCLDFSVCQNAMDASDAWSSTYDRMPWMPVAPVVQHIPVCQGWASDAWSLAYARMPGMPVVPGFQRRPGYQGCQWCLELS